MPFGAIDPIYGIIIVGVIGPLLTYIVAARRFTGEVKASDATELWAESRSIREWSADRIAQLTGVINSLETRVQSLEGKNESLLSENAKLLAQIAVLEARVTAVEEHNNTLVGENNELLEEIQDLKAQLSGHKDDMLQCRTSVESLNEQLIVARNRVEFLEDVAADPDKDAND